MARRIFRALCWSCFLAVAIRIGTDFDPCGIVLGEIAPTAGADREATRQHVPNSGNAATAEVATPAATLSIRGRIVDENDRPLGGIQVVLYRMTLGMTEQRLAEIRTSEQGVFRFEDLMMLPRESDEQDWHYLVVATSPGRATRATRLTRSDRAMIPEFKMPPAAKFSGQVIDQQEQPIAGATVWHRGITADPLPDVLSATTGPDGRYEITDLAPFAKAERERDSQPEVKAGSSAEDSIILSIRHPDYAESRRTCRSIPGQFDFKLRPGGAVHGCVFDEVSGAPAAGCAVWIWNPENASDKRRIDAMTARTTRTDEKGEFRFGQLSRGAHVIWASAADRVCVPYQFQFASNSEMLRLSDVKLVAGGWIEGRIRALSGEPVIHDPKSRERLQIGVRGPSRPLGAPGFPCWVDDEGRYQVRVAAGTNAPFIMSNDLWERTWRKHQFESGVVVKPGETVVLNFRLLDKPSRPPPPPRPKRDPVQLPPPVIAERDAAETIRDLGGWYELDGDSHVVSINMVYHDDNGTRYDNSYTQTDEAMYVATAFPRLRKLYLHGGQATDESMQCLAQLKKLDTFFVWNATELSDASARHLANLSELKSIHLNNIRMGDRTLEMLATLPNLERMSLQKNAFTDAGLVHLAGMVQLKSLWIGMSKGTITDAGLESLAGLENLEQLDLQQAKITDAGLARLHGLANLKRLFLSGSQVSEKGIAELREAIPGINVSGK